MKKIKLLTTGLVASLATVTPLMVVTSCNKGGSQDPTKPDIDIKTNKNIKIECDTLEVGKEATLKYTLDSGYALDLENSSITFNTTNNTVYLIQCEVDRTNKTITVPDYLVTSTKATIDIKAENNASAQISTQEEYEDAWKQIYELTESRQFSIDAFGITADQTEGNWDISTGTLKAKGLKEQADLQGHVVDKEGKSTKLVQQTNYSEPYDSNNTGLWSHMYSYMAWEPEVIDKWMPSADTYINQWIKTIIKQVEIKQFSKFEFDTLFNAYYAHTITQFDDEYGFWIKYNSSKKIASFMWVIYSDVHQVVGTNIVDIDYSEPTFTPITPASKENNEFIYKDSQFVGSQGNFTCDATKTGGYGRFEVPLTLVDTSKDLTISGLPAVEPLFIFNGNKFLTEDDDYTINNTTITIKASALTGATQLVFCNCSVGPNSSTAAATITFTQTA